MKRFCIIAGGGDYPRMIIDGAHAAGVGCVDIVALRGSTKWATSRAADHVHTIGLGEIYTGLMWLKDQGYEGAVFAGQVSPLSLFRTRFDPEVKAWLKSLKSKNAHSIFGKLSEEFERVGVHVLPASLYMDKYMPREGVLTERAPTQLELDDIDCGAMVAHDVGHHDVGQTVMVKEGMVLAVEAFEGTNAAIKRGGKLGGKGSIVFKAARVGHDMRFDIPVVGLKTLKLMKSYGATALAFQAGRLILLERDEVIAYANKHGISIVGVKTDLPYAPLRLEEVRA